MKIQNILFAISILFLTANLYSQQFYDIKNPGNDYMKKCQDCISLIKNKPKEIQFGIKKGDDDNLYFIVTHKEWYDMMIKKSGDGLTVDIVSKERYDCANDEISKNSIIKGELLKPLYKKELEGNMLPSQNGEVIIKIGEIPTQYRDKEVEFNIIFLKNKYLCYYNSFFDLKTYRWDLMDMGFYFDTLTYQSELNTELTEQAKYILQNKKL